MNEEDIVDLIKSQTKEGFEKLYDNYSATFYGVICRTVADKSIAEDLLQEVFVKIWRNIDKYDTGKGKLYTWMLQITRNTCLDYLRSPQYKNKQHTGPNEKDVKNVPEMRTEEVDLGLKTLIKNLDPKYKEVIDTIFFDSYTHKEAAKQLGIPLGTLKTRARSALLILRTSLQINA